MLCRECWGTGREWLLYYDVPCEDCMTAPKPPDSDLTPTETPNAKKSSGAWLLNLDSAPCARASCGHRRDAHAQQGRHACYCLECGCPEFVIGGASPDPETLPDVLPKSDPPED